MINVLPNTTIPIGPTVEVRDTGWTIAGGVASHSSCNAGTMKSLTALGLIVGHTYAITYTVLNLTSGGVRLILGTTNGTVRSANGVYTENITVAGSAVLSFYSDGDLSVQSLSFYDIAYTDGNAVTVSFFDKDGETQKKWGSYYSYSPDLMIKFVNDFFTVKGGVLWQHNTNETRNNFYGVQYPSIIQFYANYNKSTIKLFFTMRQRATSPWAAKATGDIFIPPVAGRAAGMASRLKKGNFRNYHGDWFVDFMRNQNDTRYNDPEVALYKGEELRGDYAELKLTNEDTTETILVELDVKSSASMFTY